MPQQGVEKVLTLWMSPPAFFETALCHAVRERIAQDEWGPRDSLELREEPFVHGGISGRS